MPRDVSIVGFDDIPESAHFWPPLTTVRQEFSQVGERCVSMLIDAIDQAEGPVDSRTRPPTPRPWSNRS